MKKIILVPIIVVSVLLALFIMINLLPPAYLFEGEDKIYTSRFPFFIEKEEQPQPFCNYLDLTNNKKQDGWKMSDFGYDETYVSGGKWFDQHLGVVTEVGEKRNFCDSTNNKEISNVYFCGYDENDYTSGENMKFIKLFSVCGSGCDPETGFCK